MQPSRGLEQTSRVVHYSQRCEEGPYPPCDHEDATGAADPVAARSDFFEEDGDCEEGHPEQVHDPDCKEQRHEEPTTPDAVQAVPNTHDEGA